MASVSFLASTQRYAVGALFAVALHQAQTYQTRPLGYCPDEEPERTSTGSSSSDSVSDDPELWANENSGLLRPVFKALDIDDSAWVGLEETAASCPAKHHVGAFLRILSEEKGDSSALELALSNAIETIVQGMEKKIESSDKKEKHRKYENECREKCAAAKVHASIEEGEERSKILEDEYEDASGSKLYEISVDGVIVQSTIGESNASENRDHQRESRCKVDEKPVEEVTMLSYHRKVTVLYELLTACLADTDEDDKKSEDKKKDKKKDGDKKKDKKKDHKKSEDSKKSEDNSKSAVRRKGYDARHRVALRLLATWLDIKWMHMEAIETMVACSAMAVAKKEEPKKETSGSSEGKWSKWKRGGIIGAAAITGGTLMAITGGLAAPAIAAGFGALAPTLGTIIPVIGASGFAAAASITGTVAGSVAVAASFGAAGAGLTGSKVARRIGSVDEFEFKAIGDNHNQGRLAVEIMVSGLVFTLEDFVKPWEGVNDNLERYAIQWESKHLFAVSTAIQDWLTSRIAMELMRQGAMLTVLRTLLSALAWPATLLAATDFIDSNWTIALDRSDKAGRILAEVLLKGLQGYRPVTLIGYSLGARVILKCLQCLAETEHSAELVERVVLLGAPTSIGDENWEAARRMVAGRFVNAYSTTDWTLGVAFRASLLSKGLAGIQPIDVPGIENVDVTDLVEGHASYLWSTKKILERLELDTYYPVYKTT